MRDMDWIPKDQMVVGEKYRCDARNFTKGTWNGRAFTYMRTKFGHQFLDEELHWDDGPPHGTAKPIEVVREVT